jgi:nitrite reductase (NADH) small subunit
MHETASERGSWVEVCAVEDVPLLEGRRVIVDGFSVAVFHTEEGFYAMADVCPHRGGPLSDGDVAATTVSCPLHARKVELKTGEVKNDDLSRVMIFPVEVRDGRVYVAPAAARERAGRRTWFE